MARAAPSTSSAPGSVGATRTRSRVGSASTTDQEWVDRYVTQNISWIFGYIEDPSKLLFGSDWPLVDMASYVEAYKRAIPPEHWQAVFHDNAARVFRLER